MLKLKNEIQISKKYLTFFCDKILFLTIEVWWYILFHSVHGLVYFASFCQNIEIQTYMQEFIFINYAYKKDFQLKDGNIHKGG